MSIIFLLYPFLFADKLQDVSDIPEEAVKKQGAKEAAVVNSKWKAIPRRLTQLFGSRRSTDQRCRMRAIRYPMIPAIASASIGSSAVPRPTYRTALAPRR